MPTIPPNILQGALASHLGVCVQCVEVFVGDTPELLPCDVGKHLAAALGIPAGDPPAPAPAEPNP